VATSGDTGGAVASGFLGVAGSNHSSIHQEGEQYSRKQLTTLGQNIKALEVDGVF
jgi:threonine synthase